MNKIYVMLGLLVVLIAVVIFANYDPTGKGKVRAPAVEQAQTRLPAVDPDRVQAIEVSDPDNRVRVARAGDKWVLPEKFNAPAMDQRPNDLLKGLQGLDRAERVSKSAAAARDKSYGLEPATAKRVRLFDDAGKLIVDLWVGKPDQGGERTIQLAGNFVRLEGSDAVYSHGKRLQHLVMPQLSMWLDGRMVAMDAKDLEENVGKAERVMVEFDDVGSPDGSADPSASRPESKPVERVRVVLTGKDPETQPDSAPASEVLPKAPNAAPPPKPRKQKEWTLVEPADADIKPYAPIVEQILRGLFYSRAEDVVGSDPTLAEYGFDRPVVDVEVRFADGTSRHLRVGKAASPPSEISRRGGSYRFAHLDGVPRVFLINEYALAQFRKKVADFKQPDTGRTAPGGQPAPISLPQDGPDTRK